ncbi:hypothetical protein HANVADRAFT_2560 [Hanseniaspora valbyensis NRRL Y-1626]|uniref:Cullin family profile domain-containing protein n=1 Tax=Hanseniaspora valbyensis NRRL Y-1626 TaxID=766949 RepID=A0A1B7TCX8_9ASCO|nr:hypothetical protein HANVADRAFT_2560 [Hanseniaspora valbyensis NRRL Y-1626]
MVNTLTNNNSSITFVGLKLLINNNRNYDSECSINFILNGISGILQNESTSSLSYQDLYNKIYYICLCDSPEVLYQKIDLTLTEFFEARLNENINLTDFIKEYDILNKKLQKIDSLFVYLNRKIDSNLKSVYDLAISKFKQYILLNDEIFTFLETEILKEIVAKRKVYQNEDTNKDISVLNNILTLLKDKEMINYDNLEEKIINQFKDCFINQLNSEEFDYNIYNYCNSISEMYEKDNLFIKSIDIIDKEMELKIYNEFISVFITAVAPRLISDEMFINDNISATSLKINDQYILDYIYSNDTQDLINNRYKSFLYDTLQSQNFQINKNNINSKKEYLNLVNQLTILLVTLYQNNLKFIETGIISTENRVNATLKLVLNDFFKLILNNDDKIQLGIEENQWFMVLIRYIDVFIHSNDCINPNLEIITSIINILDGLEEERFEKFIRMYESLLSKRLMNENSNTIQLEYSIVKIMEATLNHQNGRNKEDITRMGHMVNDFITTKKLNKKFMEEADISSVETDVKVLNQFFWSGLVDNENSKFTNLIIPVPLQKYLIKFEQFYQKNYDARHVKWLYQHWMIDFEHFLNGKTYLFTVPFITSIIFYHMINADFVTIKSLKKMTGLPTKQIVQNLATLSIKYGLILHYDKDMKLSEEKSAIKDGDFFAINSNYTNERDAIKINVISITKK